MDIDKWAQLKESLKKKFPIEEEGIEDLMLDTHTEDGVLLKGTGDFIVLQTPIGKVKLSFHKKPMVLNKKLHFSHRAGQAARTEYKFSDSEFTYRLHAFKWNEVDEDWDEIDADNFS